MKRITAAIILLWSLPVSAQTSMDREIAHLLNYIDTSGCIFIRNGSRHDALSSHFTYQEETGLFPG